MKKFAELQWETRCMLVKQMDIAQEMITTAKVSMHNGDWPDVFEAMKAMIVAAEYIRDEADEQTK